MLGGWSHCTHIVSVVGGLEPWNFIETPIVGMMIQSDELIFFRGVGIPSIRSQCISSFMDVESLESFGG